GVADILFEEAGTGLRASVRFSRFRAAFRNPGQGAVAVDEDAIGGAFGVELSPRGAVEVVDTPPLDPALLDLTGPVRMVRPLFVPLPGSVQEPTATWVDTLTTAEESGETRSRSISVVTSMLAGDTVVAGSRLVRIRTRTETSRHVTGRAGGVELEQQVRAATEGEVLWDAALGMLVRRTEAGTLEGTLELPGLGVGAVPVRGRVSRAITLRR
ncbi:MAG: hypothetical protein GWM90_22165, partial [Gemmatimonadetes bacterium]|nr:hypothetical protein [Gemmatimonadota bacterium]NIQ57306.1 hypothetical protein [Gemmatimonadota bacterium]NIU77466.1 hypothetical protein [Gammaproteobacteria bacterium]NIX46689.1 hypothetical protein [Gemmatimonadota bacterium]NIY11032.1 hypothetical protein [Gemmatimonadota bacterium]